MRITIPNAYLKELINYAQNKEETHCFLFGAFSNAEITIGRLWKTPSEFYDRRTPMEVELKKDYVVQALEYARHNNFAIIDVHSHPFEEGGASFSDMDNSYGLENGRWIKIKSQKGEFPKLPFGMIVVSGSGKISARVFNFDTNSFDAATVHTPLDFSWVGKVINKETYDRQIRLWGIEGQKRLANAKISIIGLGGLGVFLCEELARMGVKHFTLIDGDIIEKSNLNRLSGFYREHLGFFKVDIVAMNIKRITRNVSGVKVIRDFLKRENLHLISDCDLLIGAVDRDGARLLINELAVRYLIPYFDIGTGIKVNENGAVSEMGGQIRFVNPGSTPCLQCYAGGIDPFEAALDLMSQNDIRLRRQLGYVEGTSLSPEPSVIPLNGILASLASQEISKLITGFHQVITYIHYDGLNNVIKLIEKSVDLRPQKNCPVCGIGGLLGLMKIENQRYILNEEQKDLQMFINKKFDIKIIQ